MSDVSSISRRSFLFTLAAVTCLDLPLPAQAARTFEPFSFAFVTDVHLAIHKPDSYKLLQESQLFLQDCVKALSQEKLDFVIFGGDQVETPGTDDSNWQLFLDIVQALPCPWSFVLGEADVSGTPPVDKLKTYGPDWKGKGIETSAPYWSQSPLPGVHIIGLDTSRADSTRGDIAKAQLDWLKQDLNANHDKFTIIFSHHPILPPPPFDSGPPWDDYTALQGDSVREILGSFEDVRLAVNGHLHISKIQQERNIWYVSSPSLVVYPCAYRIFHVTPTEITVETYYISFPAIIKKAKQELDGSTLAFKYDESKPQLYAQLAAGNWQDQNVVLPLIPGKAMHAPQVQKKKEKREKKERAEPKPVDKNAKTGKTKESSPAQTDTIKSENKNPAPKPAAEPAPAENVSPPKPGRADD